MAILKVARLGHPVLRAIAEPVPVDEIVSDGIQKLIDDMTETMREYGGVGLAAPQVHEPLQIVVIEAKKNERYPPAPEIPLCVYLNPTITPLTTAMEEDWEGCLSAIDFRGRVPRYRAIRMEAYDRQGKKIGLTAEGFFSRALQHECDHLIGKLFLDRMTDLTTLSYVQEYQRYSAQTAGSGNL